MQDLQSIQAEVDQRRQSFARTDLTRVGENCEAAGAMNQSDGFADRELFLGDESGLAIAQVAIERVTEVGRPATGHKGAGDVWPPDSAAIGVLKDSIEGDADPKGIETLDNARRTSDAHLAKRCQSPLELRKLTQVKPEDMRFDVSFYRAQLDATDDPHSELRCRRLGIRETSNCVMVRERKRRELGGGCRCYDFGRSARSVRRGRVSVKIDEFVLRPTDYTRRRGVAHEV
jgi:hypothetical protein